MNPEEVIKWLRICSVNNPAVVCEKCPYNKDPYEEGCGKLLADASLLLSTVYGDVTEG